jgi:hypothetical protein
MSIGRNLGYLLLDYCSYDMARARPAWLADSGHDQTRPPASEHCYPPMRYLAAYSCVFIGRTRAEQGLEPRPAPVHATAAEPGGIYSGTFSIVRAASK